MVRYPRCPRYKTIEISHYVDNVPVPLFNLIKKLLDRFQILFQSYLKLDNSESNDINFV